MPKFSDIYAGQYLNSSQLPDPPGTRRQGYIVSVNVEQVGQDRIDKVVLSLRSSSGQMWPRPIVVNKTNGLILSAAYGDDINDWVGKPIEVFKGPVQYQGKVTMGIKMEPASPLSSAPSAVPGNSGGVQATLQMGNATVPLPTGAPAGKPNYAGPGSDIDDEVPF